MWYRASIGLLGLVTLVLVSAPWTGPDRPAEKDDRRVVPIRVVDGEGVPVPDLTVRICSSEGERTQYSARTDGSGEAELELSEVGSFVYVPDPSQEWSTPTGELQELEPTLKASFLSGPYGEVDPSTWIPAAIVDRKTTDAIEVQLIRRVDCELEVLGRSDLPCVHALVEIVDRDLDIVYGRGTTNLEGKVSFRLPPGKPAVAYLYSVPERPYPRRLDGLYGPARTELGTIECSSTGATRRVYRLDDWPDSQQLAPMLTELLAPDSGADSVAEATVVVLATQLEAISKRPGAIALDDAEACELAVSRVLGLLDAANSAGLEARSPEELRRTCAEAGEELEAALTSVQESSILDWRSGVRRETYSGALWTAVRLVDQAEEADNPERGLVLAAQLCDLVLAWDGDTWTTGSAAQKTCSAAIERAVATIRD